ncbi:putative cytochrome oxidase assembly protein [Gordonia hirsuta DSM 44140 = NBRC 16056]|uniref:Putative cytochrome oxidase assembly protein n=1 Tax=Gordonia hirsuta DSM 44140 = NBRC 16056 TaxID=1121927 RepID=L7LB43_9ACTN|nr:COX15/CtaA family protein [Gordonia hirsuta]GAC57287.1 putative cytochrome oxidase assembly protein [Gordonia hirsuta DSM 44140 = NBRC 16056]
MSSSSSLGTGSRWLGFRTPSLRFLHGWAIADLAANILLVVTGGAVRVTGSGLGCPTWPQCGDGKYTPPMSYHGVIEFGNRMLTWLLVAIAVATWIAAMRYRPVDRISRRLATWVALGIPLQAVIGGITVLTKLNPWVVAFHFLLTMVIISLATWLVYRTRSGGTADPAPIPRDSVITRLSIVLALTVYVITWITIYLGTVVTGSGPHSGDENSHRNGLQPTQATQLHVDAVWSLVGLSFAILLLAVIARLAMRRATYWFGGLLVLQGVVGYVQYASGLPILLVLIHMLVSALLMVGATLLVLHAYRAPKTADLHDGDPEPAVPAAS